MINMTKIKWYRIFICPDCYKQIRNQIDADLIDGTESTLDCCICGKERYLHIVDITNKE